MKIKTKNIPKFRSESEEVDWWAGNEGREFVKQKSAESKKNGVKFEGAPLVSQLNKGSSVQIALRLPKADLEEARKIAARKGIGYQTLLKMLVHEGLHREVRRQ